jgi:IS5 family transposase
MAKPQKNRASKVGYVSPSQLELVGFESPFTTHLDPHNRWVVLAREIPWDKLVNVYQKQLHNRFFGAGGINPRVVIGAIIIKHICDLSDRETILQIQENVYMQHFIGFSSFSGEPVFDASLFVWLRKRFGAEQVNAMNEAIMGVVSQEGKTVGPSKKEDDSEPPASPPSPSAAASDKAPLPPETPATHALPAPGTPANSGSLIVDATACPQDIAYPTDLNLVNDARVCSERLVDILFEKVKDLDSSQPKPRTYRKIARKEYLKVAQKKHKTRAEIRHALRKQLSYLGRNIKYIKTLLGNFTKVPLKRRDYKYLLVIQTLYDQQKYMYDNRVHTVDHRIVSIHQPHVRPIVRGKANAKVEFGAKIQMSLMNGIAFLDDLSWDAFNEGTRLMNTIGLFKKRFGCYPQKVFADKIYCNRDNRKELKSLGITLVAKPLGRPSLAVDNHIRPGDRNPIEGKFGQAKNAYGMNRIKARLAETSGSWIASIVLVLNLIKIIGKASPCLKLFLKEKMTQHAAILNTQILLTFEKLTPRRHIQQTLNNSFKKGN